jgi:GNAT superfamily N-acetyltransferase
VSARSFKKEKEMRRFTTQGDGNRLWLVTDFHSKRAQGLAEIVPFDLLLCDELVDQQIRDLLGQLTSRELPHTINIEAIVEESFVLVALDPERTRVVSIGVLTPAGSSFLGRKGMIEEVVTHHDHRGRGHARRIMHLLIGTAWHIRLSELWLTSNPNNPERKGAIKLYKSEGFVEPDTMLLTRKF